MGDEFDFSNVKFPDLSGDISLATTYGTCISQLDRYSQSCHTFDEFASRQTTLAQTLVNQRLSPRTLMKTFHVLVGRCQDLVSKYNKCPSSMICYGAPWLSPVILSHNWWSSHTYWVLCTRQCRLTSPDTWSHHWIILSDVPMRNAITDHVWSGNDY